MGNYISIYDKDNNYIGYCVHGLMCGYYAEEIVKKYVPDYNSLFELEESWKKLCDKQHELSPEDKVVINLFYTDNCSFDESDIPGIRKSN